MKMLWQVFAMAFLPLFAFQDSKAVEKGEKDQSEKERRGRKDGGQEVEPDKEKLKKAMPKVKAILKEVAEANSAANDKLKAIAKSCGFRADVLRTAGKAALAEDESRDYTIRKADQLTLALEVVAESVAK